MCLLLVLNCLFVWTIFAAGPHNIEIRRVDVSVDANALNNLNANPWNENFSIDCRVTVMGTTTPAKLDIHGASSRSYRKKSYGIKFAKETAPKLNLWNYNGLNKDAKVRKFILNAAWVDGTFMRNKLTWDLAMDIGSVAPRTVWAELYFNNQYNGFYLLVEPVGDEMWKRLGWNDNNANLYKSASHDGNFFPKPNPLTGYEKKNNENGPSTDVGNLLQVLDKTPKTFSDFERSVQPVINVRDWFTYLFTCVYSNNIDGYDKNYYLYHDQTIQAPFRVITWDSDATWGNSWTGYPEKPGTNLWGTDGMSTRIFAIPEYTFSYLTHFKCLIENGALRRDLILAKVNAWEAALRDFVKRDEDKWFPNGGRIESRPFPLEVQEIRDYVNGRAVNFLNLVNARLQTVRTVGTDRVVNSKGAPYFKCGKGPSLVIPKTIPPKPNTVPPTTTTGSVLRGTVCQGVSQAISCPANRVIRIQSATWGRTDTTTCAAPNMGNTNCRANATPRVQTLCTGRNSCTLNGNNDDFTNPCPGVHKYLTVNYYCSSSVPRPRAVADNGKQYTEAKVVNGVSPAVVAVVVISALVIVGMIAALTIHIVNKQKQNANEVRP